MSYYQIIKVIRQICPSYRSGHYLLKQSAINSCNVIGNGRFNCVRLFSSLANVDLNLKLPRYEDVKTQINTLLQDHSDLKNENISLAMHYCGKSSASLTFDQRRALAKDIWGSLSDFSNLAICHAYIQTCIDNNESVNYVDYINRIKFKPNIETYKLLLGSVCNVGNKHLALNILELMKKENQPADIDVFNLLVLGYAINGGYNEANSILEMMKLARIRTTDVTMWNMLRGAATFSEGSEFIEILEKHNYEFNSDLFLDVIRRLGIRDDLIKIKQFINKFDRSNIPRHLNKSITELCMQFILQENPTIAFEIYCILVEPMDERYGMALLEEMIHLHTPVEIVISSAKQLKIKNLNLLALENITDFALRNKYYETTIALFESCENLKPHFFWPLLIYKSKENGQIGLFEVIRTMQNLKVSVDTDTLYFYIVPNCDLSDPKLLINNLKQLNFTAKEVFTPILAALLLKNNVINSMNICKHYDVSVDGQRLLKPLIIFYKKSRNFDTTLLILQRICETNLDATDWSGIFLQQIIKGPKNNSDFEDYLKLLKILRGAKLSITTPYYDNIMNYLESRNTDVSLMKHLRAALEDLMDMTKHEIGYIEHPRHMSLENMECHLIELIEKQMDTRGLLRRLIQEHARLGNHQRLVELREIYRNSGYSETAGLKGSILNCFILVQNMDEAVNVYDEIKREFSSFNIDFFKIINLAALLIKENQFDKAMDLLNKESTNIGHVASSTIERNCWKLLSSCATSEQVEIVFKYLMDNNVCKVSNIILGPLVKVHLNSDNLVAAVKMYKECVERYKCTPLQLELLTKILQKQDSKKYLAEVLSLTTRVRGVDATRLSLLAALAENNYERPIVNFLLENEAIPSKLIEARCDRWVTENKLSPLLTLWKAIERLPAKVMDKRIVQNAVLKFYTSKQDCDSALQFYEQLRSKDIEVDGEFNNNLINLLKRYNYTIPDSLYL